ncbi:MAG: hypothetical protein ABI383_08550 [Acidobacteriaceae bacterium]
MYVETLEAEILLSAHLSGDGVKKLEELEVRFALPSSTRRNLY